MDKLVKESFISKAAGERESYVINKEKKFDYEFDAVKEEVDGQMTAHDGKSWTYECRSHVHEDITRTKGRSDAYVNGSTRTEQGVARKRENGGNTPTSRAEPAASRESFVPGADNGRANINPNQGDEMDIVMDSRPSQDKRFRKASTPSPRSIPPRRLLLKVDAATTNRGGGNKAGLSDIKCMQIRHPKIREFKLFAYAMLRTCHLQRHAQNNVCFVLSISISIETFLIM
ncbi:hypothetical protein DH2020_003788 [Rehmannia glutinosa]|uniref:Uncharacterized protein n=1 Tax=Rehmannia glutinosa TaxID=99300 RepID=A0ABR0XMM4_REHGL